MEAELTEDTYIAVALVLRYVFTALGVFIAFRVLYMTLKDTRRQRLMKNTPGAGAVAELIVRKDGKSVKHLLNAEGTVGSGIGCDVRIKGAGLKKNHFMFRISNGCMLLMPFPGVHLKYTGGGIESDALTLQSGKSVALGKATLRFVMLGTKADGPKHKFGIKTKHGRSAEKNNGAFKKKK